MRSRRIFDSDSTYSCSSDLDGTEYSDDVSFRDRIIQHAKVNKDKVVEDAGFISSELHNLVIQALVQKRCVTHSENPDVYLTIAAATTVRMRRILERSLKLAKLRNMNPENSNVVIKDIPAVSFSILNAEQNVENEVETEPASSDDPKVQKFVHDISAVRNETGVKLPNRIRRYPDNILEIVPHNTRNPEITKADVLASLETEKGVGIGSSYKYMYL